MTALLKKEDFPYALDNVYCGISIGDGWVPSVKEALKVLEAAQVRVVQIKEKFGGLRIYYDIDQENYPVWYKIAVEMAINKAEKICWKTCENCGKTAQTGQYGGWYVTLCDPCRDTRDERRAKQWAEYSKKNKPDDNKSGSSKNGT